MTPFLDLIFSDLVFGLGVPLFVTAGCLLLSDEFKKFTAAKGVFCIAAAWICGRVLMWSVFTSESFYTRAFATLLAFGIVGVGLTEALRATNHRENSLKDSVQQGEQKKPEVQQSSQGANGPNTNITGNNNTVNNTITIYSGKPGKVPFEFVEQIPDKVTVLFNNGAGIDMTINLDSSAIQKEPFSGFFDLDGERPLKMYIQGGTFYVDASITDGHGEVFYVKKNKLLVKPPKWDRNFTSSAVEIVDSNQRPVFQMIRRRANVIQVSGLFVSSKGSVFDARPPKAIFKYPSYKYQGQFAD